MQSKVSKCMFALAISDILSLCTQIYHVRWMIGYYKINVIATIYIMITSCTCITSFRLFWRRSPQKKAWEAWLSSHSGIRNQLCLPVHFRSCVSHQECRQSSVLRYQCCHCSVHPQAVPRRTWPPSVLWWWQATPRNVYPNERSLLVLCKARFKCRCCLLWPPWCICSTLAPCHPNCPKGR